MLCACGLGEGGGGGTILRGSTMGPPHHSMMKKIRDLEMTMLSNLCKLCASLKCDTRCVICNFTAQDNVNFTLHQINQLHTL